ncbi:unnamed protein product [Didymodactylos carnosus]|uniref:UBC core domain-containing protein n=2 Tax=Didymodactylos carnosus TaxID=1234261 RepID=A0A813Q1D6_9BILA|nr:unnamed protein product [Didymodactylos carnosus]CAF3541471.1 unnamed protein product [Didymodactylos carnosus]
MNTLFQKQVYKLTRRIDSISNKQASILMENDFEQKEQTSVNDSLERRESQDNDNDKLECFYLEITPNDGPYQNGSWVFRIEITDETDYPVCQPLVSCLTQIYHPNIDTTYGNNHNNVCLSTLNDWEPTNTLDDVLQGLLFLFYEPNVDDPLTSNVSQDDDEFLTNVRVSIEGGIVEDFDEFQQNYGYKKYLRLQQKLKREEDEKIFQNHNNSYELDSKLINLLTKEPNFKQIFSSDTLDFLMTEPFSQQQTASSPPHLSHSLSKTVTKDSPIILNRTNSYEPTSAIE